MDRAIRSGKFAIPYLFLCRIRLLCLFHIQHLFVVTPLYTTNIGPDIETIFNNNFHQIIEQPIAQSQIEAQKFANVGEKLYLCRA